MRLEKLEIIVKSVFNVDEISSKSRKREKVDGRKAFAVIAFQELITSKRKIMHFVKRDHSLYTHYESEVMDLLDVDKDFKRKFTLCKVMFSESSEYEDDYQILADIHLRMHKFYQIEASKESKKTGNKCIHPWCKKDGVAKLGMLCSTHYQQNYKDREPLKHKYRQLKKTADRGGHAFKITYSQFVEFCKGSNYLELKQADPKIQIKMHLKEFGYINKNLVLKLNNVEV